MNQAQRFIEVVSSRPALATRDTVLKTNDIVWAVFSTKKGSLFQARMCFGKIPFLVSTSLVSCSVLGRGNPQVQKIPSGQSRGFVQKKLTSKHWLLPDQQRSLCFWSAGMGFHPWWHPRDAMSSYRDIWTSTLSTALFTTAKKQSRLDVHPWIGE